MGAKNRETESENSQAMLTITFLSPKAALAAPVTLFSREKFRPKEMIFIHPWNAENYLGFDSYGSGLIARFYGSSSFAHYSG